MAAEDPMFREAMSAIEKGERARAKDLFTRLLKKDPNRVEHWLWMSAVVDTPRERIYCLKEVLRLDPKHAQARMGLAAMGVLPPDPALAIPGSAQVRDWQSQMKLDSALKAPPVRANWVQISLFGGAVLILAALLIFIVVATRQGRIPMLARFSTLPTAGPSPTFLPSASPVVRTATPTFIGPTPLWMLMQATYTPTPIYVATPHPISEDYRIAMRSFQRGNWTDTIKYMEFVRKVEPDSPDIDYYIGEAYRNQGKYSQALAAYEQALQKDANFAPAYLGRARAAMGSSNGLTPAARADLEKALQLDPNLIEAAYALAEEAIQVGDGDDALAILEPLREAAGESALFFYYHGRASLAAGQADAALQDARRSHELDLTFLPAYRLLGEASQAAGDPASAIEALQTYLVYYPEDAEALTWLGAGYVAAGQPDAALDTYDRALEANQALPAVYLQRGQLFFAAARYEEAAADLEKAVAYQPESFPVRLALGKTYFALERFGPAYLQLLHADSYDRNEAETAEMLYWRGQALEEIDEIPSAIKDYRALLKLDSALPEWLELARQRLAELAPPTAEPTRTLTRTPSSTRQPLPTATPKP